MSDILISTSQEENAEPYVEALKAVGVPAERIRIVTPEARTEAAGLAARAAGLVLAGGYDVAPERYGETPLPGAGVEAIPERDEIEWGLLAAARAARVPVWAVCRGLQVANVFFGGSLWQDLPSQLPGGLEHGVHEPKDALVHAVLVEPGASPLADRLSREPALVNSRHHQAIKALGAGLAVAGRSPDGLIEAVELQGGPEDGGWWLRGVQWHPENLVALAQQRALWEDFAAEARAHAAGNGTPGRPGRR